MNDPRVAANWMEDGDLVKHEKFVADGYAVLNLPNHAL